MLLSIMLKCIITEVIMTVVIFAIDIIARKTYRVARKDSVFEDGKANAQ